MYHLGPIRWQNITVSVVLSGRRVIWFLNLFSSEKCGYQYTSHFGHTVDIAVLSIPNKICVQV